MNAHAFNCITSVAPSVAHIMGFEAPKTSGAPNRALLELQQKALGGRKATRALLYNPDAIAHHLFARYTDDFLPVLRHAPLALPMQSVMPSVTPVCFASMYTGALPEVHGIRAYVKPVLTADTLFDAALRAGLRPAIVSTAGDSISKIFLERAMDYFIYDTVDEVNEKAAQLIAADEHDILVVYNGDYDATMHRFSPESREALSAMRGNVAVFDRLCTLASEHWSAHDALVAFAPDHGCHPIDGGLGSHGLDMPEDMLIPHFYGFLPRTK
ncbi:MAG: alkaline phosphatase family protein [Candidatus Spyradocola sp.]